MKIGNLVEKVNSLYQTIKNPKRLAVPIALGLALSYAPKTYSGTISDTFEDGIWNYNNAFIVEQGSITDDDEINDVLEYSGTSGTSDRISVQEFYPGTQTIIAEFDGVIPDNFTLYGIWLRGESSAEELMLVLQKVNSDLKYRFKDSGGTIGSALYNNPQIFTLKLEKDVANNVSAYVKEDNNDWTPLGIKSFEENTKAVLSGGHGSEGAIYKVRDFQYNGENIPDLNNNTTQLPTLSPITLYLLIILLTKKFEKFLKN